jgi:quercetin dioxygenase-like cupin family protein
MPAGARDTTASETLSRMDANNHFSPAGAGRAEAVLGTALRYKAEPAETGGRMACVEITVPPGAGVPPHRHEAEDEAFYVLSGRVTISGDDCEGGAVRLEAGGFFFGPRGRVHGFRNEDGEAARLLVVVTPGTGIAAMFADLAALGREGAGGPDPARVAAICAGYGITFVGGGASSDPASG